MRRLVCLLPLTAAFALKLGYRHAGADSLAWVLAPSCFIASRLGDLHFVREAGAGFIVHAPRMVVGPACAGVNFLVVSWLALFFARERSLASAACELSWSLASALIAYLTTVLTNGVRIALAAQLLVAGWSFGWLDPERLHRVLGIVLYCSALFALCGLANRRSLPAALAWYFAIALGIPLLDRAFLRDPLRFAEHAALTIGIALALLACFRVFERLWLRLSSSRSENP